MICVKCSVVSTETIEFCSKCGYNFQPQFLPTILAGLMGGAIGGIIIHFFNCPINSLFGSVIRVTLISGFIGVSMKSILKTIYGITFSLIGSVVDYTVGLIPGPISAAFMGIGFDAASRRMRFYMVLFPSYCAIIGFLMTSADKMIIRAMNWPPMVGAIMGQAIIGAFIGLGIFLGSSPRARDLFSE